MKYVVTGSLGHISAPLARQLVARGHSVTVVSSDAGKKRAIEGISAEAAIGSLEDRTFLAETLRGADALYAMIPPPNPATDWLAYSAQIAENYAYAVSRSGLARVVYLSSIGAHTGEGVGIIRLHHAAEKIIASAGHPSVTFLRPVGFYYNLLGFIPAIKATGGIASNYGAQDVIPWVSPLDIADVAAQELQAARSAAPIRYIASDELSCNDTARLLGAAIGKPKLTWSVIGDKNLLDTYRGSGMPGSLAVGLVEMQASMHQGVFYEHFHRHRPSFGKVKMQSYAEEFAAAYAKR